MIVKLLTEHHLEFLGLKGGYRGSSESAHVKMPHCWKSRALAQLLHYITSKLIPEVHQWSISTEFRGLAQAVQIGQYMCANID